MRWCDRRCTHCFVLNEHKGVRQVVREDLYLKSLDVFRETVRLAGSRSSEIMVWGGEVTLLPADTLDWVVRHPLSRALSMALEDGLDQSGANLVTHLIRVPDEKLDVIRAAYADFEEQRCRLPAQAVSRTYATLTSSFEPDTGRFKGPGVFEAWKRAVRTFVDDGFRMVVAVTATSGLVGMGAEEVLALVVDELGCIAALDYATPFGEGGRNSSVVLPEHDALQRFMSDWIAAAGRRNANAGRPVAWPVPDPSAPSRPMEDIHSKHLIGMAVDFDGTVYTDTEGAAENQWLKTAATVSIDGCGFEEAVGRVVALNRRKWLRQMRDIVSDGCLRCPHVAYCQGGFVHHRRFARHEGSCAGLRGFVDAWAAAAGGNP
jgi:hypothetical protein